MRKNNWKSATASGLVMAFVLLLAIAVTQSAQAQTYTVIHNFTGQRDGGNPSAGLTIDRAENLYGTAATGGTGYGTVFKLRSSGSSWILSPLYSFAGGNDGAGPFNAPLIFGPDGTLYGTTFAGGGSDNPDCEDNFGPGCGTVFNLRPPATVCKTTNCPWNETVLYRFSGGSNGNLPPDGSLPDGALVFDGGNIYGTAAGGGDAGCFNSGCGVVYELTPSGGSWTQGVLYTFTGGSDGGVPHGGVIVDQSGNLYGTTYVGADGAGAVYQLAPSGPPWTEGVLYPFRRGSDGGGPNAGVIFDNAGNLYGATILAGPGSGTAFELTNGNWAFNLLYGFAGKSECGPYESLTMDAAGNLYGTTLCSGNGYGSVFKLTPSPGGWSETDLYDFCSQPNCTDGANPISTLVFDRAGNLYGTASSGGMYGKGVVFKIMP